MDLKNIDLFRDFRDEELDRFLAIIKSLELRKGEILFNECDPGDGLCIVSSGAVRIFKKLEGDEDGEKSLALIPAGNYIGEMTLLEGSPRSASARAETDSTILKISREDFFRMLREYPQGAIRLFASFMKVVSERLRRTNEELVVLYEIGKIVSAAPPQNELLERIIMSLANALKVELSAVFVLNDITAKLEIRRAVGEGSVNLLNQKMKSAEGIVGRAIALKETLCVRDFDACEEYKNIQRFGYERSNMLVAPLVWKARSFGALYLAQRTDGQPFDNANVNLINAVATQAAAAVESALYHQECEAKEQYDRKYFQF
jgi:CRP/FNR family transcriptional regulator, cyclic AMP receptor protein